MKNLSNHMFFGSLLFEIYEGTAAKFLICDCICIPLSKYQNIIFICGGFHGKEVLKVQINVLTLGNIQLLNPHFLIIS